jgi:hypothetical protein
MKQPMIDTKMKEKYDDLYTPEKAVYPLIRLIMKTPIYSATIIWEPCDAGGSKITQVFKDNAIFDVRSTCITTGLDFLVDKPDFYFDYIITNPPYSLKEQFLERCYEIGKPFALWLPLTTLEGVHRGEMFRERGINVMVLDHRLDFTGKKSNWFNASWFYWRIGSDQNRLRFEEI